MTFMSSVMFARSLIFPKSDRNSSARRSLFGALVCIGLSLVPLVVVMTVTDGMIGGMTERIIGLSSGHLQAYVRRGCVHVGNPDSFRRFADGLTAADGIISAYPEIDLSALAAGKDVRTGAQIRAVVPDIFSANGDFRRLFTVTAGSVDDFSGEGTERTAVIGQKMAESLSLSPGDTFRIITTRNSGGRISPRLSSFKVAAVVSSGYQELDALWIFVPLGAAYSSLALDSAEFTVMLDTADAFSPELSRIRDAAAEYAGNFANIYRWDEVHRSEFENFSSTRVMLVFVMILIVLVASVNVSSAVVMLVMERRREIAVLKSIGGTPAGITLSFILAGTACGLGGVIAGIPAGLLCAVNINTLVSITERLVNSAAGVLRLVSGGSLSADVIRLMDPAYYLAEIPVSVSSSRIMLIAVLTLFLSFAASVLPSVKAGREKPIDILRKS